MYATCTLSILFWTNQPPSRPSSSWSPQNKVARLGSRWKITTSYWLRSSAIEDLLVYETLIPRDSSSGNRCVMSSWNMVHVQWQRLSQKRTRCYHSGLSKFNRKTIIKLNKGCHKHPTIILPKNYSIITYSTSKFSLTNWFQQQWWFWDFMMIDTTQFTNRSIL